MVRERQLLSQGIFANARSGPAGAIATACSGTPESRIDRSNALSITKLRTIAHPGT